MQLSVLNASTVAEIDAAFTAAVGAKVQGMIVSADPFFDTQRVLLVEVAAREKFPTIYFEEEFLNAGGLGILIGDGQLPNPGLEKIFEAYYSFALPSDMRVSFDYQFITNPAYNADRGPVHIFSGRVHGEF